MLKLKPFSHSAKVTYQKSSLNEITIQVSSDGINKSVIASVFPKDAAKEIEKVNARSRDLEKTG